MGDERNPLWDFLKDYNPLGDALKNLDFPNLLADAIQRSINRTWRPFTSKRRFKRIVNRFQRLEDEMRTQADTNPLEPEKQQSKTHRRKRESRQRGRDKKRAQP